MWLNEGDVLNKKKIGTYLRDWLVYLLLIVSIIFAIAASTKQIVLFRATGKSNKPTIGEKTAVVAVKKVPKRLDFIDIDYRTLGGGGIVKRIVGMPGETIEIISGVVYINGEPLSEPYVRYSSEQEKLDYNYEKIILKSNEYFVLGDNRNHSTDSEDFGPITEDKIKYVVLFWVELK